MEAKLISLDDFVLTVGGYNGESYDHKTDPSIMLKLYFQGKIEQPLSELILAKKVYSLGIPSPEPGEYVVTPDGRYGILFHKITDKKSYARACGDNPGDVARYAGEFAGMCKILHSTHVDVTAFENVKDRYYKLLEDNPFFTTAQKDKIARFISDAPDDDTAIHGDLQFGNIIFTPEGKRYFIDLGDFCYGYNLFDIGMIYLCCILNEDSVLRDTYHMEPETAVRFWECFAPAYFGQDRPLSDINELIRPYAGIKTLVVERDSLRPMAEFRAALDTILA